MPGDRCAIAVMAKAPRAGKVKTRLVPPLTSNEALALSSCFLRDVTANIAHASDSAAIDGYIAYAPAGDTELFEGVIEPRTRLVPADGAIEAPAGVTGFGRCLLHAAHELSDLGYQRVCLLNSDSPTLPTRLLVEAAHALAMPGERIVLGPAVDGGYYLIGVRAPHSHLFRDVAWSTDIVAAQTRVRAAELGLEVVELAPWYDVDEAAALRTLIAELDGTSPAWAGGFAAPATTRWLAHDGLRGRLAAAA